MVEAVSIADRITYPRGAWVALGGLIDVKRRAGREAEAQELTARRASLIEQAARSLADGTLRQELVAAATR